MGVMSEQTHCQQILKQSGNIEEVIRHLRSKGYEQIDCIKMARELLKTDLREAKRIVHLSATWADSRQVAEKLQETVEEALHRSDTRP